MLFQYNFNQSTNSTSRSASITLKLHNCFLCNLCDDGKLLFGSLDSVDFEKELFILSLHCTFFRLDFLKNKLECNILGSEFSNYSHHWRALPHRPRFCCSTSKPMATALSYTRANSLQFRSPQNFSIVEYWLAVKKHLGSPFF